MKFPKHTNVVINIYNNSLITQIGRFADNFHDANKCMRYLNDELVKAHGYLPDSIFYFISYTPKGSERKHFIDTGTIAPANLVTQCQKLIVWYEKTKEATANI